MTLAEADAPGIVPDGHMVHKKRLTLDVQAAASLCRRRDSAIPDSSMSMIEVMQTEKRVDCRLGNPMAKVQHVHCFVPKSLWVKNN
jgi:hypothetical protein